MKFLTPEECYRIIGSATEYAKAVAIMNVTILISEAIVTAGTLISNSIEKKNSTNNNTSILGPFEKARLQ